MTEARLLVVDDESLNLEIISEYFEGSRLTTCSVESGEAAWQLLNNATEHFDLVLLDRMMPGVDGIELLKRIKEEPRLTDTPVILQTAANSPREIREGLEAGAYYYLTKPYQRDALLAIVHAALSDARTRISLRRQLHEHINSLQFLDRGEFSIRTTDEASRLASFLAQTCPNADVAVLGISELLINAIEHGNLGLTYAEKSRLKLEDRWQAEVTRRSQLPENLDKRVNIVLERDRSSIILRIKDQGQGFAWQEYMNLSPERACDPNGRGIALARMLSFSSINYEGCGNTAVATIAINPTQARACCQS